jgi:two-component system sensor histidine kinase GlrK
MHVTSALLHRLSVRKLVFLGYFLALLPLLMGVVSSVYAVDRLAILSQQAVHHVAMEAQNSQKLLEKINELERKGKQYLVLLDNLALDAYLLTHEQFLALAGILIELAEKDGPELKKRVQALRDDVNLVHETIVATPPLAPEENGGQERTSLAQRRPNLSQDKIYQASEAFQALKTQARALSEEFNEHVETEAQDLETLSYGVKRGLVTQSGILLPISLLLLSIFIYLLHNPIQQMDHMIRAMGAGDFSNPIRVVGPRDIEYLGERLEWLRTRLIDLEAAKQRFMRNVSHEIKTPLATIHEGVELLADEVVGELNQEQSDIARILSANARKLDALIAQLINYSQVNVHADHHKLEPVDMRLLVLELLDMYQLQLRAKSLAVEESLESVEILGSADQLRTVIDNLLSNAVKYSPPRGEIRISLRKEGGHMVLEIEDDGPGIDPSERARVFEPFFQGRASRECGVKGTGFGLAIVGECVASHHGKVEVLESLGDNAGARIRVQIPLRGDA